MFGRALVRLSAAACFAVAGSPAWAQEAAQTAGGDVTADEATPLPPVVVSAPKERRVSRSIPQPVTPQQAPAAAENSQSDLETIATSGSGSDAYATAPGGSVGVFTLGQLDLIGGSTITNEAMWTFNKNSLDKAVSILPGVSMQNSGGHRNERDIFVRGFDRFRVPLYIDGVRINLPYDNRLDMNRFLTPDLAEIQVQKGYVSVLNGPGGMGGAINMVSRKPTKAVELEGRAGAVMNGDIDDLNQWSSYAYAGTRQTGYYAQISGNIVDQDHFNLSDDFTPATPSTSGYVASFPYENGGDRDRSNFQDWRVNAKVGITPNAADEYTVNYTYQEGEKGAPLHVTRQIVGGYQGIPNPNGAGTIQQQRYWDWPAWDISTLSWLSKTQLGEASYVKSNAYYNTFENTTRFFPDLTYNHQYEDSPYDDNSYGGFVEFGTNLIPMNTLKGAIHYRRDTHNENSISYNTRTGAVTAVDPSERDAEETWSFAAENTFHATRNLDIVAGISYDQNEVIEAFDTAEPLPEKDTWNWQSAAIYSYSNSGKVHATVSSRTRFPTLFDRYSTRFGSKTENPGIDPERATNYELGWTDTFFNSLKLSTAVFYSDIEDSIQNAFFAPNGMASIVGFNADGDTHGLELSADWDASRTLRIGGNYTYLERDFDYRSAALALDPFNDPAASAATNAANTLRARKAIAAAQVEGTPTHTAFIYASWKTTNKLTLTPSVEIASDRTVLVTSCKSTLTFPGAVQNSGTCNPTGAPNQPSTRPNYTQIGAYALLNFQAEYAFNDNASLAVGATNILDENYALADGFPEAGRQFFANARVKF